MADFKTHMLGAALVSGVAATGVAMASNLDETAILGLFAFGVIGGILPDVDSDGSIPIRVAFALLSVISAFLVVFQLGEKLSLLELIMIGLISFLFVRYCVFHVFTRFTVHRGLIHSIPAALIAGILTAIIAHDILGVAPLQAWSWGAFVSGGFLVHLILDEMYSVDLMGRQLKRSFGTAFNLGSLKQPIGTLALYMMLVALFLISPPYGDFFTAITDGANYQHRLIPEGIPFSSLLP